MKERRPAFPVRQTALILIFLIAISALIGAGLALRRLDYFNVKHVLSNKAELTELSYLKGRNIFSIDLRKEAEFILGLYPSYRKIRVVRVLPDRLYIDFLKRRPLAFVKHYRYFCVDEDAVLFDVPKQLEEPSLPLIIGLETKIFGPKPGRRYQAKELLLAIDILREAARNKVLKQYKIRLVDVANASQASFFIADGPQVKVAQEDVRVQLEILGDLLRQSKQELADIKYIDLRFKEPVIKLGNQPLKPGS